MKLPSGMIDERAAAKYLGYDVSSLKKWRVLGKGPAYYRVRGRVLYTRGDLKWFLENHAVVRVEPKKAKVQVMQKARA
jgi:hypothetical protein